MPLGTRSDRQSTVSYAIDLLRAHQIRRENVFLHEQVKNCLKEVAALRDQVRALEISVVAIKNETKDLTQSIKVTDSTTQKALVLAENHEHRLNEQSQCLAAVQQSAKAMESELSGLKVASTKSQEDENAKTTILGDQIHTLEADCRKLDFAQQRQAQAIHVALESFRMALEAKVDISAIETLEDQLEALRARPQTIKEMLPSVSHVSESTQVLESQWHDVPNETERSQESHNPPLTHHNPPDTVPEDLDLDANAHTIGYAGHHRPTLEQNESLNMLPPLAAQATQLARVKTLRQRRFDDWDTYYDQGQKLIENLPSSFEETVVHNFVDGLFKAAHMRQCRQWLDSNGWTWANITAFGDSFSQVVANNARDALVGTLDHVNPPRLVKDLAAATVPEEESGHDRDKKISRKPKASRDNINQPLRRSQRLIEKDNQSKDLYETSYQKTDAARTAKIIPASTKVNIEEGTTVNDVADERTKFMKPAQSIIASRMHVDDPQRKAIESGPTDANGHRVSGETQVSGPPGTRKRKSEPAEEDRSTERSKSNQKNMSKGEISKPELVSAKQQDANTMPESSDDANLWLREKRPGNSTTVKGGAVSKRRRPAKYSTFGARPKKDLKKPRLPLPPPPEIPITDTTEEE